MTDHLSSVDRSENMSRIRGKNTAPELVVRRLLHRLGFRFRLHRKDIPGKPDIILPKYKTAIFVHGCYWHRHDGCARGQSVPSTNKSFWLTKFGMNMKRDAKVAKMLADTGWRRLVVWECEVKPSKMDLLEERLRQELTDQAR